MYHGSILERNGLDIAVEAVAAARAALPQIELRVYGEATTFLTRVLARARQLGLGDSVRYAGPKGLEDIVDAIDNCDVGIIPNRRSAFTDLNMPTRIFEYLSRGKPVIAPRTRGIQDYFGADALLFFNPGDPGDLARALVSAHRDPVSVTDAVKRGQDVYLAHRWSGERARLMAIVRDLVGALPRAAAEARP
jgi:glycosyltransferase involved in cell wall biosynthesis